MAKDIADRVGFDHPAECKRKLQYRTTAFPELVTTVALIVSIAVAATAVSIGIARADVAAASAVSDDGSSFAVATFLGLVMVGMGGLTAAITHDSKRD